jgi:hypothetical protein
MANAAETAGADALPIRAGPTTVGVGEGEAVGEGDGCGVALGSVDPASCGAETGEVAVGAGVDPALKDGVA